MFDVTKLILAMNKLYPFLKFACLIIFIFSCAPVISSNVPSLSRRALQQIKGSVTEIRDN